MSVEDPDTNTSPEESEAESTSTSESTNESTDTTDSSSSSDSDEGQEDEETSSGSEGSAESWDQESNRCEEDVLAKKREDFDKIQEVAAHMDNVFRRLSSFFPHTEDYNHKTPVPVLPSLPHRNKAMERGVSERKLAVNRDVSVASDSNFNGGFSVFEDGYQGKRSQEINEGQSGLRGCLGQTEDEGKRRLRVKNRKGRETTVDDARGRMAQWNIETEGCAETPSMGIRPPWPGEKRGSYVVGMMHSGHREHMLWDELRDSLVGREGSLSGCRKLGLDEIRRGRAAQEKRRGLINEAISVLLEPSSEEEDMKSN